jgi:hypothetical protein
MIWMTRSLLVDLPATSVTVTVKWSWTLSSPAVVVGAAGFLVGAYVILPVAAS